MVTNYPKFGSFLEQHRFLISQFCQPEGELDWVLCSGSQGWNQGVGWLGSYQEILGGKKSISRLIRAVGRTLFPCGYRPEVSLSLMTVGCGLFSGSRDGGSSSIFKASNDRSSPSRASNLTSLSAASPASGLRKCSAFVCHKTEPTSVIQDYLLILRSAD